VILPQQENEFLHELLLGEAAVAKGFKDQTRRDLLGVRLLIP
jgi:hypothetical protein